MMEIIAKSITLNVLNRNCSAANAIEMAVNPSRNIICSGSLIAVLKRMIDKAPTSPKDSANDDLMVVIMRNIEME